VNQRGFTLVEVLLSMAIIGTLAGLSLPVYESFVRRNDLDLAAQQLAASLRRAETYARSVKQDAAWSVRIEPTSVVLYQGTNFGGRDTAFDETFTLPGSITTGGLSEIQFAKWSATPSSTGNITLTSSVNETRTIAVNAKGMVNY
jgi:prepilin-type N-terminal cleavage/methylation domain-containing protein